MGANGWHGGGEGMGGEHPVRYKMMGGMEEMIRETESGGQRRGWVVSIQCSTLGVCVKEGESVSATNAGSSRAAAEQR